MLLPRSHYGLGGQGTTPANGGRVNAPARAVPRPRRAVRREQMSDEVAGHLRAAIMSGTLLPGTFIRLDETAAQLGVSITPVREALRTLRGEGMVLSGAAPRPCRRSAEPTRHRGHLLAAVHHRQGAGGCRRGADHRRRDRRARAAERRARREGRDRARRRQSPLPSSRSTARSITRRAASSWRGFCFTSRATCRR